MKGFDTSIGGPAAAFPTTVWSQIVGGRDPRTALERLARAYWRPVYVMLRAHHAKSNEDAKDLTQDFFAWMIESGFLGRADRTRGRFRAFVKTALRNYVTMEHRREQRQKRGGGRAVLSLDASALGGVPVSTEPSPEQALDRAWRDQILAEAGALLDESCRRDGRELYARLFREYYLDRRGEDQASLAARYGLTATDVANYLARAKTRFREIVAALVAETVRDPQDLDAELRELFGSGGP